MGQFQDPSPQTFPTTTPSPGSSPYLIFPRTVVRDESQGDVVEEIEAEGQEEHVLGKFLPFHMQQCMQRLQGQHLMPVLGIEHPMGMRQMEKDHFQKAHLEPRGSKASDRRLQSSGAMDWLDGNAGRVTPSSQGSFFGTAK